MKHTILGLDLGSNSVGWALLVEQDRKIVSIKDSGVRVFPKSVADKEPTPKNQTRRAARLGRRVLQRRARRKQEMINYLVSLNLLPDALKARFATEKILNQIDNPENRKTKQLGYQPSPYHLRTKALDEELKPYELGRILLHFVARRGFLSTKKQLVGDLIDDPDTQAYLKEIDAVDKTADKEEKGFKLDIQDVYESIRHNNCRTLGEYLYKFRQSATQRNRDHDGGHLRTERKMYQQELRLIWEKQEPYFSHLPNDFFEKVNRIIFYQRPLKLKADRVGKCSLEPKNQRARQARLEAQQFRYYQDINNLIYKNDDGQSHSLTVEQKQQLAEFFEENENLTITKFRKLFGFNKHTEINLSDKALKGNLTACAIRKCIDDVWDNLDENKQKALVEDLLSIQKKSVLKKRLVNYWNFETDAAIKLCLLELEPGHGNLSLKAIRKLLPFLKQGCLYSKKDEQTGELGALQLAGYDDGLEHTELESINTLPKHEDTNNPIVNKGLNELRKVINAVTKEYGKPDTIRIEMARDLEMNTQRYKDHKKKQKDNEVKNEEAINECKSYTNKEYPSNDDIRRYRLWKEQGYRCAYSKAGNDCINLSELWTDSVEIDHIVPRSLCLDNSYTNIVLCKTKENRNKGQNTPIEYWGGTERWNDIERKISEFYPDLPTKKYRKIKIHPKKQQFSMTKEDVAKKYGMSAAQLNDTRYTSKLAQDYVKQLGCDVSVTKGQIVSTIRKFWGLNSLVGKPSEKDRSDHRHHLIDACVIATIDRNIHNQMITAYKKLEEKTELKLFIPKPYSEFRNDVSEQLQRVIISHDVSRKLTGPLHEATGVNYLKQKNPKTGEIISEGTVCRKTLNKDFKEKNAKDIVDARVREIVLAHIAKYGKQAMLPESLEVLKIGKNPIKRVRVWQSKTTFAKLKETKFAAKDKGGKFFKWSAYGNNHHVEIIQHKQTKKVLGKTITMLEAKRRATTRGTQQFEPIVQTDHGDDYDFLYVLYINDLVSVMDEPQNKRIYYRVQKFNSKRQTTQIHLRLHTASTVSNNQEELAFDINKDNLFKRQLQLHRLNVLGKLLDD